MTRRRQSLPELEWLYTMAPPLMGVIAIDYEEVLGGGSRTAPASGDVPDQRQAAGARSTEIRRALKELTPRHQSVVECAYSPWDVTTVPNGPKLVSSFGRPGARVVWRARRDRRPDMAKAQSLVAEAKRVLKRARRRGDQPGREAASQAVTEAKGVLSAEEAFTARHEADAVRLLDEAHQAYLDARKEQRAQMRVELDAARAAARHRSAALLAELLDLPSKERNQVKAEAWLQELGAEG